ncbi:putative RNA recognition motif domain, nucleotide-binding alpha-beta plait domain superfamily [Helianthus anomalus]
MAGGQNFKVWQWYDVPAKKGRGNNGHNRSNNRDSGTKFFVSNLPERCSSADLVQVLKRFGDIQGTYIARKYDRLGKRYVQECQESDGDGEGFQETRKRNGD